MMMTALRAAALVIAVLAVADPALTSTRRARPLVAIVAADPVKDALLSDRVARELDRRFTVVRGAFEGASGTVLAGDAMPDEWSQLTAPLMAVVPTSPTPSVRFAMLDAPATSPLNARVPVSAGVMVIGARGRRFDVQLKRDDVVVDHRSEIISSDSAMLRVPLVHVPTMEGTTSLRAVAVINGTSIADSASTAVDAGDRRFDVLFFDPRASWLSTFVRRAVEGDTRFTVTHRVVTSRGVSNTAGAAPVSLRDEQVLDGFETIVVGAPEQLTESDAAGLDAYMRRRGGRVVLLMDRRGAGTVDRLTGVTNWRASRLPVAAQPDDADGGNGLRAQEIAWPVTTPAGASLHSVSIGRDSSRRAVVWSISVGAGRLLVSGALDAWHYRDRATSGFDSFWTTMIAELSANAPPVVDVAVSQRSLAPGETGHVRVTVRDAMLSNRAERAASVAALLVTEGDSTMVRLWPEATPGAFSGTIVAPQRPGTYRLIVSSGSEFAEAPIVVDPAALAPLRDDRNLVEAFVSSRGGTVVQETQLSQLPSLLSATFQTVSRVETWHPMRSAWWIVPFALLLGAEWWWRRRRGQA